MAALLDNWNCVLLKHVQPKIHRQYIDLKLFDKNE